MLSKIFSCCSTNNIKTDFTVTIEELNKENDYLIKDNIKEESNITYNLNDNSNNNLKNITNDNKNNNLNIRLKSKFRTTKTGPIIIKKVNNDNGEKTPSFNFKKEKESLSNINNIYNVVNNINNINITILSKRTYYTRGPSRKNFKVSGKESQNSSLLYNVKKNIYSNNNLTNGNSFVSFNNIIVKKSTNTNEIGDTEILSPFELLLSGEIFYNCEVLVDRLGIKNSNNYYLNFSHQEKKMKPDRLIRFGIPLEKKENKEQEKYNIVINNVAKTYDSQSIENKSNHSIKKNNTQFSSWLDDIKKYNIPDLLINIPPDEKKKICEEFGKNCEMKYITLFTIKYDISMEMYELCSIHDNIPLQLLLNFPYQIRCGYVHNILLGNVNIALKVEKNNEEEDIITIKICKDNKKDENNEKMYIFNPNKDKMPISLGRKDCNIILDDPSISKIHAFINYSFESDNFYIKDNETKNGTFLVFKEPFNFYYINSFELYFRLLGSKFQINLFNNEI